jgi:topoisomerase IA-like protein
MPNRKQIFLKPKNPELAVRKPKGGYLASDGEFVERSAYWMRRIQDGDVVQLSEKEVEAIIAEREKAKKAKIAKQKKAAAEKAATADSNDKGE